MKKKWMKYTLFMLFMICFIFAGKLSLDSINNYVQRFYIIPVLLLWTTNIVLYIGFGVLMGLGDLIKEKEKMGEWKINFSKLIIIGIPSLIFGFLLNIIILFQIPTADFMRPLISGKTSYMILFKILFGYIVITSFYKQENIKKV